jgi:hypothetical protein
VNLELLEAAASICQRQTKSILKAASYGCGRLKGRCRALSDWMLGVGVLVQLQHQGVRTCRCGTNVRTPGAVVLCQVGFWESPRQFYHSIHIPSDTSKLKCVPMHVQSWVLFRSDFRRRPASLLKALYLVWHVHMRTLGY